MRKYLLVGSGGMLGAVTRYSLGSLFKFEAGGFPYSTFIINLSGSFLLGLFLSFIIPEQPHKMPDEWRLFFATGCLGAYTTFSSFTNETLLLYQQGYLLTGLLYSAGSLVGGMFCVGLGLLVAHLLVQSDS